MIFYFPNRPNLIPPDSPEVDKLDASEDWDAEIKKNGSRLSLHYDPLPKYKSFSNFLFWERHKKILTYEPSKEVLDELRSLELPFNTHIDAELLHNKVKGIRHQIYVYDIYQYGGMLMMDELRFRRERLENIFNGRKFEHLSLAIRYQHGFRELFYNVIKNEADEGLVMKNIHGKIVWNAKVSPDVWWQIKIRREKQGNYSF